MFDIKPHRRRAPRLVFLTAVLLALSLSVSSAAQMAAKTADSAHDFSLPAIDGGTLDLAQFKGKTILLVNTASYCGFTKQYDGLQKLWEDKRAAGLVVLGVPSNDFGAQEPGSKEKIKEFCQVNFAIDFPMSDKLVVRGPSAHPLYQWLAGETGATPKWNFYKFLIDGAGRPVTYFSSMTAPQSKRLINAIDASLAAQ